MEFLAILFWNKHSNKILKNLEGKIKKRLRFMGKD